MAKSKAKSASRANKKKPSLKTPAIVENGSKTRSSNLQGPVFPAADLERARKALIWTMNDHDMSKEVLEFRESTLAEYLRARKIPLYLTRAAIDELIAQGVIDLVRNVYSITTFVPLDGSYQTDQMVADRKLRTTRQRWWTYSKLLAEGPKSNAKAIKPKTRPKRPRDLEARDQWLYRQCTRGVPYKEIKAALNARCAEKRWGKVTSIQGIRKAAHRYAAAHRLPQPPSRRNL